MNGNFELVRLVGEERRVGNTLAGVSKHWRGDQERFLFIGPHDDDIVLGGGLMMLLAREEKVPVHTMIVTDGSLGYCSMEEKETIAAIRRRETYDCFQQLGVPEEKVVWMGFPDCSLALHQGRRPAANPHDPSTIQGYTGLQNAFTYQLRRIRPTQIFLPTYNDLHPDHKFTYQELFISVFHASGDIWPELGKPLTEIPHIHEMAVYCDFPSMPKLRLQATPAMMEQKLAAIQAFKSQKQIKSLVESMRQMGSAEFFRPADFSLYNPLKYNQLFDETALFKTMQYR
jgi:LmbE family N-acetylglucosaminyl deacetylase